MVFLLGFLVSGLLTLLFLPAFWRRAVRLSTRRLETRMPLSLTEIVAERDQLRAVFATQQRQLEQKVEAMADSRARDLGELGRRAASIVGLEGVVAATKSELARTEADLVARTRELAASEAEIGALNQANWIATGMANNHAKALDELTEEHARLAALADERRATIAGLGTRVSGLEMRIEDLSRRREAAENEIAFRDMELAKLAGERDALRVDLASETTRRESLLASAAEFSQQIARLEEALRAERRERARFETEAENAGRALAESTTNLAAVEANHARRLEEPVSRLEAARREIEDLRAEREALEGALEFARAELARGGARPQGSREVRADGASADAGELRESIREIGAEVARLVASLRAEAEDNARAGAPSQPLSERVRELQARARRVAPTH